MKKTLGWIVLAFLAVALSYGGAQDLKKPLVRPDLVVTGIDFQKVQSGTDAQGKTYWIFNVTAKIKNQGNGNAGAFKVLLERNNGAGGAWQTACQTCVIDISGLAAGAETTTAPRQFNNANGMPSRFRFTADSAGQIGESNEGNNSREETFISATIGRAGDIGGGVTTILKPDLAPVSITFQDVTVNIVDGKSVMSFRVAARVRNNGPGSAAACMVAIERGSDWHVTVPFKLLPVPALTAGAETTVLTEFLTHEVGTPKKYYLLIVDSTRVIGETDEDNNVSPAGPTMPSFPTSGSGGEAH